MDPHYQSIWFNLGAGLADMIVGMVTPNTKGAGHGRLELPCHNLKQTPYVSDGMWSFMSPRALSVSSRKLIEGEGIYRALLRNT